MSRPVRRGALAVSLVLAVGVLGACTDDGSDPDPTGSGSGTSSGSTDPSASASPSPVDRSREVVDPATALTPIATTKAAAGSTYQGATFTVYALDRTDASTVLVWSVTPGSSSRPNDSNVKSWGRYPVLEADDTEYAVVTFTPEGGDTWSALSDPTIRLTEGEETGPQYAMYPPLPAGTTEVTLKGPWLKSVKVPVTDLG